MYKIFKISLVKKEEKFLNALSFFSVLFSLSLSGECLTCGYPLFLLFLLFLLELELLQNEQFQREIRKGVGVSRKWKMREEDKSQKEEELTMQLPLLGR